MAAAIRSAAGTYTNIYAIKHVHKTSKNSTVMKPVCKASSPLGSYSPSASPIAGEGGPDRSCPGKSGFEPGSVASNAELQQGGGVPRGC
jgi:hypothetical protein